MCGMQLECPLCCNETFSTSNALKEHLMSLSRNLMCKICDLKFEGIDKFAEHIDSGCYENVDRSNNVLKLCKLEENDSKDVIQMLEDKDVDSCDIDQMTNNDLYHCSTCDVNFTSVEEHIRTFHQGHEVFLEETDSNVKSKDNLNITEDVAVPILVEESILGLVEDDRDIESQLRCSTIPKRSNMDSCKEKEKGGKCKDKIGQMYEKEVIDMNDLTLYQCPKCPLYFYTIRGYEMHRCDEVKCGQCDSCFPSTKALSAHMKVHKTDSNKYKSSSLTSEMESTGPFVCDVCNTEFHSFKSLKLHGRMHDPVKSKEIEAPVTYNDNDDNGNRIRNGKNGAGASRPRKRECFTCEVCNKSYDKEYEQVHRRSHNDEENFNCETCNRKFYTRENLEMHTKVHVGTKKFSCSYCKKAFLTYENLHNHVTNHCQKSRQYECQFCGRRFARPHEKVKHERIHTGEKPHVCQICGKAFRVSYCLTLHMRTHSGTRPYQCSHCGKRFKAHSVFNHHLLTHSEERNYKCPYCPKAFKTGVQLAGHKNSHTKPFSCTVCNRPFASLYAVRTHMETHQRQNNLKHKCWVCGASYARAFALRDHIKEQHYRDSNELPEEEINIKKNDVVIEDDNDEEDVDEQLVNCDDENVTKNIATVVVFDEEVQQQQMLIEVEAEN